MAGYPTTSDIVTYGTAMGLFSGMSSGDITTITTGIGESVVREWEERVNWNPFTFNGTSSDDDITLYYDPPGQRHRHYQGNTRWIDGGKVLFVNTGILSLSEIRIRVTPDDPGTALVEDQDFWLLPYDANTKGLKQTSIRFSWPQQGLPKSITLTGKFGYCYNDEVPDDVILGLKQYAVAKIVDTNLVKFVNKPIEWQEGDVRERYISDAVQEIIQAGKTSFAKLIGRYRFAGL